MYHATSTDVPLADSNFFQGVEGNISFTGCQLEVGDVATGFEFEPYATTQNKCYRYYFRMEHDNYVNKTSGYQQFLNGLFGLFNDTYIIGAHRLAPVEMRSDNISFGYSNLSHFDVEPFDQAPNTVALQSTSRWGIAISFSIPTPYRTTGFAAIVGLDTAGSWYEFDADF